MNRTIRVVYTAAGALRAAGALETGTLELTVPQCWSRTTKLSTLPGFTSACGAHGYHGQTRQDADDITLAIVYHSKAPAAEVGSEPLAAPEQSPAAERPSRLRHRALPRRSREDERRRVDIRDRRSQGLRSRAGKQ